MSVISVTIGAEDADRPHEDSRVRLTARAEPYLGRSWLVIVTTSAGESENYFLPSPDDFAPFDESTAIAFAAFAETCQEVASHDPAKASYYIAGAFGRQVAK
jgi:hypothetical protein